MSLACLRSFFLPALLASTAVLVASFHLESVVGLVPCALCFSQRLMLGVYALVCLAALVHSPAARGRRAYAGLALASAFGGALLAGRHVWLQGDPQVVDGCHLPVEQVLQRPLGEILQMFLLGSPDCVSISWSFLDLTLPEWSLLAFLLLAAMPLSWLVAYRFRKRAMA
ncbi:disulfide bond formation protein B [Pseudomonas entomophila]|uniref:Disulfide bond formation protein B 2 n=2 Tax=Pseudomonas entomophila TaxID=312306 RepID=DSBB2_PSEE4|nr:disulfide bond formation protein B [Pseudomonas entomophila]Q1IGS0.1 RecName: Full=Disulfide bond formation protein B 2; AltName: Full=Disulfide oxidoreductase 2 [Pseudomonas entomophila L48]WMW06019.1 disulfide bond formation protein B [Pseudomonas entomophila]CAK13132.1 putative disulfide bond formation protein B1 (Disulfide oxidoreductase 1) [Pseudomonas entomophila L48]